MQGLVTIRVTDTTDGTTTTIRVEGRLTEADVPDLRAACESANPPLRLARIMREGLTREGL